MIVIVGVLVAVAAPVFRSMRYEARKAALEGIRATLVANMNLARTAWHAQGVGPGSTVLVNGEAIEVWGEGAIDADEYLLPPGTPTPAGMYRMLRCGSTPLAMQTTTTCDALPGLRIWARSAYLAVWDPATGATWGSTQCFTAYFPAFGYDPTLALGVWSDDWATHVGSELYSATSGAGGC